MSVVTERKREVDEGTFIMHDGSTKFRLQTWYFPKNHLSLTRCSDVFKLDSVANHGDCIEYSTIRYIQPPGLVELPFCCSHENKRSGFLLSLLCCCLSLGSNEKALWFFNKTNKWVGCTTVPATICSLK